MKQKLFLFFFHFNKTQKQKQKIPMSSFTEERRIKNHQLISNLISHKCEGDRVESFTIQQLAVLADLPTSVVIGVLHHMRRQGEVRSISDQSVRGSVDEEKWVCTASERNINRLVVENLFSFDGTSIHFDQLVERSGLPEKNSLCNCEAARGRWSPCWSRQVVELGADQQCQERPTGCATGAHP